MTCNNNAASSNKNETALVFFSLRDFFCLTKELKLFEVLSCLSQHTQLHFSLRKRMGDTYKIRLKASTLVVLFTKYKHMSMLNVSFTLQLNESDVIFLRFDK